jgi:hypothetical protein
VSSLQGLNSLKTTPVNTKKPENQLRATHVTSAENADHHAYAIPTLFLSYIQPPLGGDHVRRLFFVVVPVGDATAEYVPA